MEKQKKEGVCSALFAYTDGTYPYIVSSNVLNCDQLEKNIRATPQAIIIGITGRKGSGKDVIGNYFHERYGGIKIAFADALKKACKEIFGFTNEQVYGNDKEKEDPFWHITPRTILQCVGTELFREKLGELVPSIGESVWIQCVKRKIENLVKEGKYLIVITDVRFQNEIDMIHSLGGKIIRVSRIQYPKNLPQFIFNNLEEFKKTKSVEEIKDLIQKDQLSSHTSEINIDKFSTIDFELENNSSFEELHKRIDDIKIKIYDSIRA